MQEQLVITPHNKQRDLSCHLMTTARRAISLQENESLIRDYYDNYSVLYNRLEDQQQQIVRLHSLLNDKTQEAIQNQKKISQLELQLVLKSAQMQVANTILEQQISNNNKLAKQAKLWKKQLTKSNDFRRKLIEEKEHFYKEFKAFKKQRFDFLMSKHSEFCQFHQETYRKKRVNQRQQFQSLLGLQQQQLHQRNQQIIRLSLRQKQPSSHQQLKNTIKHLRIQLGRYSSLVAHTTQLLSVAENAIAVYTQASKDNTLQLLKTQIKQKEQKISSLEDELGKEKGAIQEYKQKYQEVKNHFEKVIIQNQNYHQLLLQYKKKDSNEIDQIQREILNQKQNKHQQITKWANVSELIEVNEHLRRKLKIII